MSDDPKEKEIKKLNEIIERAWVLIANAYSGNWDAAPSAWHHAATKWRDKWMSRIRVGMKQRAQGPITAEELLNAFEHSKGSYASRYFTLSRNQVEHILEKYPRAHLVDGEMISGMPPETEVNGLLLSIVDV